MSTSEGGYTFVIGVPWQLWDLVDIPLLSLQRAEHAHCVETILAVDTTHSRMVEKYGAESISSKIERFADIKPRVLFYNEWQHLVARAVNWNWVDCWLTWAIALAAAKSRYAMLHDFDAVVVDRHFCEDQLELASTHNYSFVGVQTDPRYPAEDGSPILMTIELMLDVQELRSRFHPIHLFNSARRENGVMMSLDILRDVQFRIGPGGRKLHSIREEQLVHPSQVISQWKLLKSKKEPLVPEGYCPLFIIPYFRHVAGDSSSMFRITEALEQGRSVVEIEGSQVEVQRLDKPGQDWIADQVERLEHYFSGSATLTGAIQRYCTALRGIVAVRH
jgi:hypothetical protein